VLKEPETNAIEIAACIAPRRQLLISCGLLTEGSATLDPTHDFPAVGMPFIQEMYRRHSHPERVRNVHLPLEPHDFGPSKRKAVYAFLAEALGFEDRPEDLAAIAIEPPGALAVFNTAHPLPPNALRGSEAVAQGFRRLSEPPR
jgi:hypothetical protein